MFTGRSPLGWVAGATVATRKCGFKGTGPACRASWCRRCPHVGAARGHADAHVAGRQVDVVRHLSGCRWSCSRTGVAGSAFSTL